MGWGFGKFAKEKYSFVAIAIETLSFQATDTVH
jgi:hypothetical protein